MHCVTAAPVLPLGNDRRSHACWRTQNIIRPSPRCSCLHTIRLTFRPSSENSTARTPKKKNSIHLQDAVGKSLAAANVQNSQSASLIFLGGNKQGAVAPKRMLTEGLPCRPGSFGVRMIGRFE